MQSSAAMNKNIRLETVLSFIKCGVLADIGTDHAFVPIQSCLTGKCERVIACDVNAGPLGAAKKNIFESGFQERIETRLGDGLKPIIPGETDCIVISGIGGMGINRILNEEIETARSVDKLILQPQHDAPRVRTELHGMKFEITDEKTAEQDGRFYHIIVAVPSSRADSWSEADYLLGRYEFQKRNPVWKKFIEGEINKLYRYKSAITNLKNQKLTEINRKLELFRAILRRG